jgi:hypothetical protein
MLTAMDSDVPAAGPWAVLALAVLGLAGTGVLALRTRRAPVRPAPPAGTGAAPPVPSTGRRDDLPAFFAEPPSRRAAAGRAGTAPVALAVPGAGTLLAPAPPSAEAQPGPAPSRPEGMPLLVALAAGALLLVALAAVVALLSRGQDHTRDPVPGPSAAPSPAPPSAPAPAPAPAPVPDLPVPPSSPSAGQPGAGELAFTSLPLGRGDETVRLTFGGVVLEPRAVGATVTYPGLSLTVAGDRALAHLQLPTANCLSGEVPADPSPPGCAASQTEYADLPSPALRISRSAGELVLTGRFATYTRPNGSGPVYTGRAYDLTITVVPGPAGRDGRATATGALTLGDGIARTVGGPTVDVVQIRR